MKLAGWTGLEPATFCVTGRRSNQLSYHPVEPKRVRNVESELNESSAVLPLFASLVAVVPGPSANSCAPALGEEPPVMFPVPAFSRRDLPRNPS